MRFIIDVCFCFKIEEKNECILVFYVWFGKRKLDGEVREIF